MKLLDKETEQKIEHIVNDHIDNLEDLLNDKLRELLYLHGKIQSQEALVKAREVFFFRG